MADAKGATKSVSNHNEIRRATKARQQANARAAAARRKESGGVVNLLDIQVERARFQQRQSRLEQEATDFVGEVDRRSVNQVLDTNNNRALIRAIKDKVRGNYKYKWQTTETHFILALKK